MNQTPTPQDIERCRTALLDYEAIATNRRHALERAVDAFCEAVIERDKAAARLAVVIAEYAASEGAHATSGPYGW